MFETCYRRNLKLISWTILQIITAVTSVPEQSLLSFQWPEFSHFPWANFWSSVKLTTWVIASCSAQSRTQKYLHKLTHVQALKPTFKFEIRIPITFLILFLKRVNTRKLTQTITFSWFLWISCGLLQRS